MADQTDAQPLADYLAERTGCNMRRRYNQQTLLKWLQRADAEQIRARLDLASYPYPASNSRRTLKQWEWVVFAPKEEVLAFAL